MAYRYGNNRYQRQLMPQAIDEYIESDDPVRAYDAFIEALDLGRLGIDLDPKKTGNPEYHPKVMLKIIVYGYSYGIHSSRKLERALYHNLFALQIDRANGVLGSNCNVACADSGYASTDELEKIDKKKILVVVPSQRQASEKKPNPLPKSILL